MTRYRTHLATALCVLCLCGINIPAFAVNKEMVQLQTQVQQLEDAVARLQQSNDERMGVLTNLVQQSADSVNKMSVSVETLQRQLQTQQDASGTKVDQVSGQIQALNDSLDEIKARLLRLEKLMQDVQGQQQSMSAAMQGMSGSPGQGAPTQTPAASALPTSNLPPAQPTGDGGATLPTTSGSRRSKPSAAIPATPGSSATSQTATADDLYKSALGDYMGAKYSLAQSEFADISETYPDNPLSGNAYYYQGEIDYRGGRFASAIKNYDKVLEQYPDSKKVPVSHLHKGEALLQLKQSEAGARELRSLIQRFPASPEAVQARSKLNGLGIPINPRRGV